MDAGISTGPLIPASHPDFPEKFILPGARDNCAALPAHRFAKSMREVLYRSHQIARTRKQTAAAQGFPASASTQNRKPQNRFGSLLSRATKKPRARLETGHGAPLNNFNNEEL
jgi:hypothetical protein